ncbi:hypothetical protein BDR07DRAFT_1485664 [Suillus spraguei]|nr:hypothetical protein BDR07DRAFT_1485664 [Suillus spraguei]
MNAGQKAQAALRLESIKLQRTNDYLSRFWLFCPGIMKTVEGTMFGALIGATSQDVPAQSPPLPKLFSGPLGGFPRQVSLPLLQELHYGYFCVGDDIRLFSGFRAPNLIKLTLENRSSCRALYLPAEDDGEDDKANSLLKYCATHLLFPKLEELSLYSVNASVDTFTLFMDAIPTLLHLLLHCTPNVLPALLPIQMPLAGVRISCPSLESIYIFPNPLKDDLIATLKERSSLKCLEID